MMPTPRRSLAALALALVALAACQFQAGAGGQFTCPDGTCPSGLTCRDGRCVAGDGFADARSDDDDGGASDGGAPDATVIPPNCGDGVLQANEGELCDLGLDNADDGRCLRSCRIATCGDGKIRAGVEACDPAITPQTCTSRCLQCAAPDGVEHDGKCYVRRTSEQNPCGGGNVLQIEIQSAEENLIIDQLYDPPAGTTQLVHIGMLNQWQWFSYEALSFLAWGAGEPSVNVLFNAYAVAHPAGDPEAPYWVARDVAGEDAWVCEHEGTWVWPGDGRAFTVVWGRGASIGASSWCQSLSPLATLADLGASTDPALIAFLDARVIHGNGFCIAPGGGFTCPRATFSGTGQMSVEETAACDATTCIAMCELH